MSPPDFPRPRLPTLPPSPPTTLEQRVWSLEHGHGVLERDLTAVVDELKKAVEALTGLQTAYTVFSSEKSASDKRRAWWLKLALTVTSGLVVAGFTWIAAVFNTIQKAHIP